MAASIPDKPLRILLIEDNPHDVQAFRRAFESNGRPVEIEHHERGETAQAVLKKATAAFDIAVVDQGLPGDPGLDFCKWVLAEGLLLPTVLLTVTGSETLAVEALKSGVFDYLIKNPGGGHLKLLPTVLAHIVRRYKEQLDHERADEALRKERDLFQAAINSMPGIFYFFDRKGKYLLWNKNFEAAGDLLLKEVAGRLASCVRETDTVFRFGGDEFTIVLTDLNNREAAAKVAENVNEILSKPFELRKRKASIGASIGISLYPTDGTDPESLMKRADEAMYSVKERGKNHYRFISDEEKIA